MRLAEIAVEVAVARAQMHRAAVATFPLPHTVILQTGDSLYLEEIKFADFPIQFVQPIVMGPDEDLCLERRGHFLREVRRSHGE